MGVFRDEKKIAELLEQIGGIETPISGDLEERMISGLEVIAKSGGVLPTATSADAGKAVMVDKNGEYELAKAESAESNVLFVNVTIAAKTATMDTTFGNIKNAFNKGNTILVQDRNVPANVIGMYLDGEGGGKVYVCEMGAIVTFNANEDGVKPSRSIA